MKKIVATIMVMILMGTTMAPMDVKAQGNNITFTVEIADDISTESDAIAYEIEDGIMPYINSDGTFSFTTNGYDVPGATLVSDAFKFSATTAQLNITSYSDVDYYYVYLEKDTLLGWSKVMTITFHTGGLYGLTLTDLSTSAKYRLRFYSPNGTASGNGTISNYVHLSDS